MTHTRPDESTFEVVHSSKRGDLCFRYRPTGWYWYQHDALYGIDESTISGPFRTEHKAARAGHMREVR